MQRNAAPMARALHTLCPDLSLWNPAGHHSQLCSSGPDVNLPARHVSQRRAWELTTMPGSQKA